MDRRLSKKKDKKGSERDREAKRIVDRSRREELEISERCVNAADSENHLGEQYIISKLPTEGFAS